MKEKFDCFDVNNRILLIMKEKNLNKNSLSKQIGLSQPAITKIENHKNLPSFKLLFELLRLFPDISAEWLLIGKGEMYKTSEQPDLASAAQVALLKEQLAEKDQKIAQLNQEIGALKIQSPGKSHISQSVYSLENTLPYVPPKEKS